MKKERKLQTMANQIEPILGPESLRGGGMPHMIEIGLPAPNISNANQGPIDAGGS